MGLLLLLFVLKIEADYQLEILMCVYVRGCVSQQKHDNLNKSIAPNSVVRIKKRDEGVLLLFLLLLSVSEQ